MDFEKAKKAYDSMSWQQQKQFAEQNKNNPEFQQFAQQYLGGNKQTPQATQPNNTAPVENNQQNQDTQDGQNWGNNGWIQSSQNQETEQTQGMPQQPAPQDSQNYQFWYWTTEEYRKQRDTQFAQQLYQSNPNTFDYDTVFNYVKSQAPQVSQGEISNTVKNIQRQWLQHSRIGMMGTASVDQIRNGILNGQFSQSDLELLRTQNPQKYQEYLAHDEKLNAMSNAKHNAGLMNKLYNWESVKEERSNQDLVMEAMEKFFGNINYNSKEIVESYKQALNSPEIQRRNSKVLAAQREMQEIDDDLETLREDLTKQYPWISKTQLNQILYDRSYKAMRRKNELHRDYIMARGETQFLMNLAEKNFEADMKWVELQRAEFTDKYNALGFAKGILEFETPQQKRQAELDQIRKKAQLESELNDINSKDPKIQFNALMKALEPHYKEFGSIILRPQAQVAQDILALAKKEEISVGEAMRKNFTEPLYKKPEYRAMMNNKVGISNNPTKDSITTIDGEPYVISRDKNGHISIKSLNYPSEKVRQDRINTYSDLLSSAKSLDEAGPLVASLPNGEKAGQCGAFANDIATAMWSDVHFWSTLSQKLNPTGNYTKSDTPQVGSFAIFNSKEFPSNGHVGVVTKVNADWSFVMKSSNESRDERLYTSTHTQGSALTFIVPKASFEGREAWGWYDKASIPFYEKYLTEGQAPGDAKLKQMWWLKKFQKEAEAYRKSQWGVIETKDQKKEIEGLRKEFRNSPEVKNFSVVQPMYDTIKRAANQETPAGDLSLIFAYMKILDPNSTVREGEFANAQNAWGVDDKIRNAYNKVINGTRLSRKQREDFVKNAGEIYKSYALAYNTKLAERKTYSIEWWDVNRIWSSIPIPWEYWVGYIANGVQPESRPYEATVASWMKK